MRTYSGTTVLGNFVSQIFFDEIINDTVLAQSAYSRTTARDTTNARDMVYQVANKERMLATLSGSVTAGYTASLTAGVTLTVAAVTLPAITTGGVGNAVSGAAGVTPGSWISIYGTNFASATRALASSDVVNSAIPITLGGVSVLIDGKAAYVQYVSPTQINVLSPADSNTGSVTVTVTNSAGTSNSVTTTLQPFLPGLSSVLSNYVRAVRYPDGAIVNGTGAAEAGYVTSAAVGQGDIVALFGTGFGPTSAAVDTGTVFTGAYATTNAVTVMIGGVAADVLFAGLVGPGLYQINVRVPASLSDGDKAVVATVAGVSTQSSALLNIAESAKLVSQNAVRGVLARLLGDVDSRRGRVPALSFSGSNLQRLMWLAGLTGPAQHEEAGSHLARVSLQAAEQQGGMIQIG